MEYGTLFFTYTLHIYTIDVTFHSREVETYVFKNYIEQCMTWEPRNMPNGKETAVFIFLVRLDDFHMLVNI